MGAWAGLQRLWQPVGWPPGGLGSGAVNSSRDLRAEHMLLFPCYFSLQLWLLPNIWFKVIAFHNSLWDFHVFALGFWSVFLQRRGKGPFQCLGLAYIYFYNVFCGCLGLEAIFLSNWPFS